MQPQAHLLVLLIILIHKFTLAASKFSRSANNCTAAAIATPKLPGSQIRSIIAAPVLNYDAKTKRIDFCNVTLTYTHTGWNDHVTVTVWLPLENWDSRLVGKGGGGWAARSNDTDLAVELVEGRAAVTSDAGHQWTNTQNASDWALDSNNNVNIHLLQNFASVSLNDAAIIGKAVVKSFYKSEAKYSYWNGCSTGGRQGHMLAQRYPNAYDGILAGAPAINYVSLAPAALWPLIVMSNEKTVPPRCVLETFVSAVISECDRLDGLIDGIIAAPSRCKFNSSSLVGRAVTCDELGNKTVTITSTHAGIVEKIWQGPQSKNGSFLWYGVERGTAMNGGFVNTKCNNSLQDCSITHYPAAKEWVRLWVLQKPDLDLTAVSYAQYEEIMALSRQRYQDIIATNSPDLSGFKAAGGKMITWHGMADARIFYQGTREYYQRVEALDPNVREFYRYFEAPGVDHCGNGVGPAPVNPLEAVIAWVENGTLPEILPAKGTDNRTQPLCPWPLVSAYQGGNKTVASSFACMSDFPASLARRSNARG